MTIQRLAVPNPAAGADWRYAIPGQYTAQLIGVTATLTTLVPPTLLSQDSFDRANGPIGSTNGSGTTDPQAWTQQEGTWNVLSNQARTSALGADPITGFGAMATLDLATPNVDLQCVHAAFDGNGQGLIARYVNTGSYVVMLGDNTKTQLLKATGATFTNLTTTFQGLVAGTVMRLTVDSSDLYSCYIDGVLQRTATDPLNHSATIHGLRCQGTAQRWDNWIAHDDVPPTFGSRLANLEITDGTTVVADYPANFATTTGAGYTWSWSVNASSAAQTVNGQANIVPIPPMTLPAGYTVGTKTPGLTTADQWSGISVWIDDGVVDGTTPGGWTVRYLAETLIPFGADQL